MIKIFFVAVGLILSAQLHAVQLCVPSHNSGLSNFLTGTSTAGGTGGAAGSARGVWSVELANGAPVSGIWMCGNSSPAGGYGATNTSASGPSFGSTASGNANCWCRMTQPSLGAAWVFLNQDPFGCASACVFECAVHVQHEASFRAAVLAVP